MSTDICKWLCGIPRDLETKDNRTNVDTLISLFSTIFIVIRRICSDETDFEEKSQEMAGFFFQTPWEPKTDY